MRLAPVTRATVWCRLLAKMAPRKRLSKSQYETLAAFRYALRQFLHFSEAAAQAAGITAQHHQALLAIKGFPGRDSVTVGELAERLQLRHHSAVGLIDRLVSEALVSRSPSDLDRRQVYVQLTERGNEVLEGLSSAHAEQLKRLGPELLLSLKQLTKGQLKPEHKADVEAVGLHQTLRRKPKSVYPAR